MEVVLHAAQKSDSMNFSEEVVKYFNISFRSPATDACSECIRLTGLITACTVNCDKIELMTKLRVHKLKAKTFYKDLKTPEEKNHKTFLRLSEKHASPLCTRPICLFF